MVVCIKILLIYVYICIQEHTLDVEPNEYTVKKTEHDKEQDRINTEFKVYCNNFRKVLFYQDEKEETG